jgi:hypothetical protein
MALTSRPRRWTNHGHRTDRLKVAYQSLGLGLFEALASTQVLGRNRLRDRGQW